MAAPTLIGTPGSVAASAGTVVFPTVLTPSTGSGYAAGDVLLCYTASWGSSLTTVDTPANWTKILDVASGVGRMALFAKVAASASEAAPSVSWNVDHIGSTGDPSLAQVIALRGADTRNLAALADVVGAVNSLAATFSQSAGGAGISTVAADDLVLSLTARGGSGSPTTLTAPSGFTLNSAGFGTTSGTDMTFGWARQAKTTPGAVASPVFGFNGSTAASIGVMVAIKAAPVGIINNDTCSGSLPLSGSAVESWTKSFSDVPAAGTVALSGSVIESNAIRKIYNDAPAGAVAITGSAVDSYGRGYTDARTGTLALSGTCVSRRIRSDAPTGALALTGSATSIHDVPSAYEQAILATAGLVSYWRLGEPSGNALDSKDGNPGSPIGVSRVAGLLTDDPDGAMQFAGSSNSYVNIPTNLAADQALTVEFWCQPTAVDRTATIFSKWKALIASGWSVSHTADGRWKAEVYSSDGYSTDMGPVGPVAAVGQVQHVVMTYDVAAGSMRLYVNGVSVGSQSRTPPPVYSPSGPSTIGKTNALTTSGFAGVIDDVAFYNVALTPVQVQDHFLLGGGIAVDRPLGTISLSGSTVESSRRQSTRAGTLKLAGSVVERWLRYKNDAPSGALGVTGSVVERYEPPKVSGTIPLSGTVKESCSHVSAPTGSMALSGVMVERYRYSDAAIGAVDVIGVVEENREISDVCAGVLKLVGIVSQSLTVSSDPSGALVLTGRNSEFVVIDGKIFYDDFSYGLVEINGRTIVVNEDITPGRGGRVVEGLENGRIVTGIKSGRLVGNLTGRVTI
jgi:hypothetical protein